MMLSVLPLALEVSDNMDFGELIVGVGTLALAAITGLLAWKTSASVATAKASAEAARESADAARESAKAERDSVEAMAMPYVIAVPRLTGPEGIYFEQPAHNKPGGTMKLHLWNLGSGPGIVTSIRLISRGEQLLADLPQGIPLAAGDQSAVAVGVASGPILPETATLQIEYLHSNGRAYRTDSDVTIEEALLKCLTFRRSLVKEARSG